MKKVSGNKSIQSRRQRRAIFTIGGNTDAWRKKKEKRTKREEDIMLRCHDRLIIESRDHARR